MLKSGDFYVKQKILLFIFFIMSIIGILITLITQWWWGFIGIILAIIFSFFIIANIRIRPNESIFSMVTSEITILGIILLPLLFNDNSAVIIYIDNVFTKYGFSIEKNILGIILYLIILIVLSGFSYILRYLFRNNTIMIKKKLRSGSFR